MRQTRLRAWFWAAGVATLAVAVGGCGDDDRPSTLDSGAVIDAGAATDSGSGADAGPPDDSGSASDSGRADSGVTDAGSGDAGPPTGILRVQSSCMGFDACGGAVEGTWTYAGACVEVDGFSGIASLCPGATVAGEGTVVGTLTLAAGTVTRRLTTTVDATLEWPCLGTRAGATCADVQTFLMAFIGAFECADADVGCTCTLSRSVPDMSSGTYSVSGGVLTTMSPTRTFDYCVSGDTLQYRETSAMAEPGVFTLER